MEWLTLQESPSSSFGQTRSLTDREKVLLRRLFQQLENVGEWIDRLDSLEVREMPDGGMGSLYFVSTAKNPHECRLGQRVAELQFNDADGVTILASLNVDTEGELYELDIWRTDFRRVIQLSPP